MPTNWKYIKKQLEKEFLCEKLKGHITYDLTRYEPRPWEQQYFIMKHDQQILLASDGFAFFTSAKYQEQYLHKVKQNGEAKNSEYVP